MEKIDLIAIDGNRLRYGTEKTINQIEKLLDDDLRLRRNAVEP